MFKLFKKPLEVKIAARDIAADLERGPKATLDRLADSDGISSNPLYSRESAAFTYVLGILSIQSSELSAADKHRFSAEFTGAWVDRMKLNSPSSENLIFFQNRLREYYSAMNNGKGRDWFAAIVFRFMEFLSIDTPEHVAIQGTLYMSMPGMLDAFRNLLNETNKTYKFT